MRCGFGNLSSEVLHNQPGGPGPRTQVLLFGSTGACIRHDASEKSHFMQPCEGKLMKIMEVNLTG